MIQNSVSVSRVSVLVFLERCLTLTYLPFQEDVCLPKQREKGTTCYKSIKFTPRECVLPCGGFYASLKAKKKQKINEKFRSAFEEYKNYKSGFVNRSQGSTDVARYNEMNPFPPGVSD